MELPRSVKANVKTEGPFLSLLPSTLLDGPGAQRLDPCLPLRSDFGLMQLICSLYCIEALPRQIWPWLSLYLGPSGF